MRTALLPLVVALPLFSTAAVDTVPPMSQPGLEPSSQYSVTVHQGATTHQPFVHLSRAQLPQFNRSQTVSFTSFAFTGTVRIEITKFHGDFKTARVLPSSYGIPVTIAGNTVAFDLDRPRKISVEFDGDITHALLLFADAPATDVPSPDDPNVLFFGPGFHDLAEPIRPKAGQTVYLAAGAVVQALIEGRNVPNVTVRGRGILTGRKFGHTGGRHINFTGDGSANLRVEDITIVDSPGFFVTCGGPRTVVRNVKGFGWWFNTDGVSTGPDGLIEDCFFKCNDDAIKLYGSGTRVRRTTIWQMENGAPFQLSWNTNADSRGCRVEDCDVIRVDHAWDNPNEAVFDSIHGGGGHLSDCVFDNIRIENAPWRLVSLQIRPNMFARSQTLGSISGVTFRNISLTTPDGRPPRRLSVIQGFSASNKVTDVLFENLRINGTLVRDAAEAGFEIEPRTTDNGRFTVTAPAPPAATPARPAVPAAGRFAWRNPITDGLNSYGQKDFHLLQDGSTWYLVASEMPNPEWGRRGLILYASEDLLHWREARCLFNQRSVPDDAWYRDEWMAPELHRIVGRYYVTFHCRNNRLRPYRRLGFGLAVADRIDGPYRVLNPDRPLFLGANTNLFADLDGKVYATWDDDGRIKSAELNLERGQLASAPLEVLGPATLGRDYRFLDAPFVTRRDDTYYLITSSFYAGYVIRVRYCTAKSPQGPWTLVREPLMTWIESEADDKLKMPYSAGFTFAPPTQVIFHHQIFVGPGGLDYLAYHSSEKYSEPYLIIEPIEFTPEGGLRLPANKQPEQSVLLPQK